MDRPDNQKGTVVLRTLWGDVAAEGNFCQPLEELLENQDWREAVGLEGGPFCYTDLERNISF